MKVLLKFFRCSCVLMLSLIVAFSAAIGVSAVEQTFEYPISLYTYSSNVNPSPISRPLGNAFSGSSTELKNFGPMVEFQHASDTSYVLVITFNQSSALNSQLWTNNLVMAQLNSGEADSIQFPGNIFNVTSINLDLQKNNATYVITYNTSNLQYADTYDRAYFAWSTNYTGSSTYRVTIQSATAYAIYDPPGTTLEDIELQINNLINQNQTNSENLHSKIDELIQSQNGNSSDIKDALEDIKDNQVIEQNYWQTVLTYGNTYNQIDSNLIGSLGTAEDQLSSAEDALENKSQSLKDSVASQWSTIQSTNKTFITNIAPAAAAVGTVTTQIMDAAPQEVKGLFVTLPLIIFIGWLIGRIRGD